jgi:hypothetical protein
VNSFDPSVMCSGLACGSERYSLRGVQRTLVGATPIVALVGSPMPAGWENSGSDSAGTDRGRLVTSWCCRSDT